MLMQIINEERNTVHKSQYHQIELASGKHQIIVMHVTGRLNYVIVQVQNAMQRAYRGMGKNFSTTAEAIEHYKTPAIRAMIQHAGERAADLCAQGSANQETPPR
jgi:hypothetical protein